MTVTVATYASWRSPRTCDRDLAAEVGQLLGEAGYAVVFGGGTTGPMGAVGLAAQTAGAPVTAVTLADWLEPEESWAEVVFADDLASRTAALEDRADAFLVLPGGLGTAVELFSAWASAGNGHHTKPVVVLDPSGEMELLLTWAKNAAAAGYLAAGTLSIVQLAKSPADAIKLLIASRPPV